MTERLVEMVQYILSTLKTQRVAPCANLSRCNAKATCGVVAYHFCGLVFSLTVLVTARDVVLLQLDVYLLCYFQLKVEFRGELGE